jgi:Tol biopolymer transport system component
MPVDGGEPVQLSDQPLNAWSFSPDGKLILSNYYDEQVNPARWRPALISFETGQVVKVLDLSLKADKPQWTPDGRSLVYSEERDGVANLWTQPVEGGAPKQLTKFTTERIYNFAPSRDGKQFVISRGATPADIVLIKDFR